MLNSRRTSRGLAVLTGRRQLCLRKSYDSGSVTCTRFSKPAPNTISPRTCHLERCSQRRCAETGGFERAYYSMRRPGGRLSANQGVTDVNT